MENNDHFFLTFKGHGAIICSVLPKRMNTSMKQVNMQKGKTEENTGVQAPWRPVQLVRFVEMLKVKTHVCVLFTSIEIFRENVFFLPFSYFSDVRFVFILFCDAADAFLSFTFIWFFFLSFFRFGTKFSTNEPLSFVCFLFVCLHLTYSLWVCRLNCMNQRYFPFEVVVAASRAKCGSMHFLDVVSQCK